MASTVWHLQRNHSVATSVSAVTVTTMVATVVATASFDYINHSWTRGVVGMAAMLVNNL